MKKLLKSILPVSVWNRLRAAKSYLNRTYPVIRAKIALSLPLKKKPDKIWFEIHITEHCNLNCMGCNNFSCIADPEFIDVEEFRRDFARMGEIFGHECGRIYLLGGEPLLHPEINTLMKYARENFPRGDIYIFTNGILLSGKEADFWETCRDNDIGILISAYPIKIDTEKIKFLAEKYSVSVKWAWNQTANERDTFSVSAINLAGNSNVKLTFALCGSAINCITLKHGRLFTCVFAAHVHHFNKRFHQNIMITEADYIDIYDDVSAEGIFKRLCEPIPACRYCIRTGPHRKFRWQISKQEITEWLN